MIFIIWHIGLQPEKYRFLKISMNFHTHIPKFQLLFKKVAEIPNKGKLILKKYFILLWKCAEKHQSYFLKI